MLRTYEEGGMKDWTRDYRFTSDRQILVRKASLSLGSIDFVQKPHCIIKNLVSQFGIDEH